MDQQIGLIQATIKSFGGVSEAQKVGDGKLESWSWVVFGISQPWCIFFWFHFDLGAALLLSLSMNPWSPADQDVSMDALCGHDHGRYE